VLARPFPSQTVRDLVGIARLLYRTWRGANAGDTRLPERVAIGKDLSASLTMAANTSKPGNPPLPPSVGASRDGDAPARRYPLMRTSSSNRSSLTMAAAVNESAEPNECEQKRLAR
jgi:hypothetical protein